jgi:processive 1,2-diacylglycerol beta-glucosyltransferase
MTPKKRVLIISVKAGAGHIRAAAAVEEAFKESFPSIDVKNVDALEYTNAAFRKSYTRGYDALAVDLPSLWGFIYENLEKKPADAPVKNLSRMVNRLNAGRFLKLVEEFAPDAIVSTHYLPAEILAPRRRKGKLSARLFVVLTDYDIHTMWLQDGTDRYFVATDEMAYALRAKGVGGAGVSVTGIPVMPVFSRRYPDKPSMRAKLGLRADARTVLVSAGGFGMVPVDETVAMLADAAPEAQVLAVAGRNEKLRKALEAVAAGRPGRVVPFGFVTNMHELMAASDLAVTKSGGLTSSECLAMGLPMVIWNPIRGQEERNADHLLEQGVALRANSAAHLVFKVRKLLSDARMLERMRRAALAAARPRAAFDIAAEVAAGLG